MKRLNYIYIILMILFISKYAYTQNIGELKGITYQAVAVDENTKEIVGTDIEAKPLYNKEIGVRFTITGGLNGDVLLEETHTTTTDKYGLFTLTIGLGEQTGNGLYNKLMEIPWIDADQFLKVEISIKNDGNYSMVSNQQFMTVPYSFYTDDIADNAINTAKIFNESIIAEDISEGAVTSSEILNETIIAEDIASGAVTTDKILDGTILTEDIATGAVTSNKILDGSIVTEDIASGAITSEKILDSTIVSEDIASEAVTTSTILNETIINEDIADSTIELASKVAGVLPVEHGGTGSTSYTMNNILVGGGTGAISSKILASADSSISITQTADSIILKSSFAATEVTSDPAGTFNIGNLPAGSTYTSNAINSFTCDYGDIIIGSVDVNLQGCMLTAYVSQPNVIRISVFNGTGTAVNLGNNINVRVYIVK